MEANGRATEGDEAERRELERKTHELNERLKETLRDLKKKAYIRIYLDTE